MSSLRVLLLLALAAVVLVGCAPTGQSPDVRPEEGKRGAKPL